LADFSGSSEPLTSGEYTQTPSWQAPSSWSRDGQLLAFTDINPKTGSDLWVLGISDRKAQPFLRTSSNESAPKFALDGRWLAYVSDESGREEIYVQPYPGPGGKKQISAEGGVEPVWNPTGRELFYRSGNKMMAVDTGSGTSLGFTPGKPRLLFELPYLPTANYDVSPDGQRFLMLKPTEQAQAAPTQINVVLNWFEELKQNVPAGLTK
jgi:dipeptidyl aminopeptidase/acylaminoacyl peptidase